MEYRNLQYVSFLILLDNLCNIVYFWSENPITYVIYNLCNIIIF